MTGAMNGAMNGEEPGRWITAIAKTKDKPAFAALFAFYAPRIKAMLMRRGVAAATAEDLAQDALIAVWHKACSYDAAQASASAWIFTIARNLYVDSLRRNRLADLYAAAPSIESEQPARPDEMLAVAQREERVSAALRELPEEQVHVVRLSFFDGRAHGDIARLLDLPLGTVKSRLRLAMTRLRHVLGDLT